jgi:murein DD-endopeptidase MepM/ murein hydrolase activator NlpD
MTAPVRGGHITQEYGVPGNYSAGYHTGRDWAGGSGELVAVRAGKVTFAGWAGDYGNRIEIHTDGIQHSYSHCDWSGVRAGQQVAQGQVIGSMGSTGQSTGPHCHYEERHGPGYGYYDDRRPVWDTTDTADEETDMAANLVAFFVYDDGWWEANLAAGTYHGFANPQDLSDRRHVLTKSGVPWFNWNGGAVVANPEAFGLRVG